MIKKTYVRPVKGLVVIDPATGKPLPEEGRLVLESVYWRRRLKAGDVLPGKAPSKTRNTKKSSKKED